MTGLGSSTYFLTQYITVKNGLKLDDVTLLPVGGGETFVAALQQGKIDGGMTTEPTVSRLLKTGDARVLIDMRTRRRNEESALGGTYPAASFYMQTAYVELHKDMVQKLANAFVRTMHFIATHSAAQIADKMPADYYAGDKRSTSRRWPTEKTCGRPTAGCRPAAPKPSTPCFRVFSKSVKGKNIDLSRTYTYEFVECGEEGGFEIIVVDCIVRRLAATIEIENVNLRIPPHGRVAAACCGTSRMTVGRGEFVAIVGPTGCGKSTTLNLITGMAKPDSGSRARDGEPVEGIDPPHRLRLPNRRALSVAQRAAERRRGPAVSRRNRSRRRTMRPAIGSRAFGLSGFENHLPAPALGRHAQAGDAGPDVHQ